MENLEPFTLIGKLYYDLIRSQDYIERLKQEIRFLQEKVSDTQMSVTEE